MTVPPWFGWENILAVLVLLVVVAVAFFLSSAVGRNEEGRAEWEAALAARSSRRRAPDPDADDVDVDRPAETHPSSPHP